VKRSPSITILAVIAGRLARADFPAKSAAFPQISSAPRLAGARLPETVRTALALDPSRPGTHVLVLSDDLWCQSVTLPAVQTEGLSSAEVAQALAFEIEPFSGLASDASALGFRAALQADGTRRYQVVACSRADLAAVRGLVHRAGSRLAGLSHPEALDDRGAEGASPESGDRRTAAGETSLQGVLADWARAMIERPDGVALVAPPPAGGSVHRAWAAGMALTALVAALCTAHGLASAATRAGLRRETAGLRAWAAQVAKVEKDNEASRHTLDRLQRVAAEREETASRLSQRRRALPLFLRALSAACPADVVIRALRDEQQWRVSVVGLGLHSGAAAELAGRLAETLHGTGWTVHPPQQAAEGLLDSGGPWRFTMQVEMEAPARAAAPGGPPAEDAAG
jgi:hypothetical protein